MTSSLAKSKQIIGAQFQMLFFLQFSYCLMFLNIQIHWIILKTHDQQFTLTTKKSLHIIFNRNSIKYVSSLVRACTFSITWVMSKDSFVAVATDIEAAIHFGNVVAQTGRNWRRCEEVDLRPGDCFCCPELQQAWAIRWRWWWRRKVGTA